MMVEAKTSVLNLWKQVLPHPRSRNFKKHCFRWADGVEENGYFEQGNTSLMESWRLFFSSLEGNTSIESLANKLVGPRGSAQCIRLFAIGSVVFYCFLALPDLAPCRGSSAGFTYLIS